VPVEFQGGMPPKKNLVGPVWLGFRRIIRNKISIIVEGIVRLSDVKARSG
jgi:hypothetical protein